MYYNFKRVSILVVECSPAMFQLLKSVLNMLSVPVDNIEEAYSVDEAFSKYCNNKHDLVITDWLENPDTGINLTKLIRRDPKSPNHTVPIIMTAGTGHEQKVIKSRDAGVSDYVVKPFSATVLATRLENVIEDTRKYVISDSFVGPDRRRGASDSYSGEERRVIDPLMA